MWHTPPPPPLDGDEVRRRREAGARTLAEIDPDLWRWHLEERAYQARLRTRAILVTALGLALGGILGIILHLAGIP